jgi:hypothetical protein
LRICITLLFLLPLHLPAQQKPQPNQAVFAYFNWQRRADTAAQALTRVGHYRGQVHGHSFVSENPATAKQIVALLNQLKANGTEDINKCFIPRHYIALKHNDSTVTEILICFECDGIRFSSQKSTTPVKSAEKREKLMARLKALFRQFHFDIKGKEQVQD